MRHILEILRYFIALSSVRPSIGTQSCCKTFYVSLAISALCNLSIDSAIRNGWWGLVIFYCIAQIIKFPLCYSFRCDFKSMVLISGYKRCNISVFVVGLFFVSKLQIMNVVKIDNHICVNYLQYQLSRARVLKKKNTPSSCGCSDKAFVWLTPGHWDIGLHLNWDSYHQSASRKIFGIYLVDKYTKFVLEIYSWVGRISNLTI